MSGYIRSGRRTMVPSVAWALFHCTLGDVLIALGAFLVTAIVLGRIDWPVSRSTAGSILVVVSTMAYTAWSEWYNVYRVGSWRLHGTHADDFRYRAFTLAAVADPAHRDGDRLSKDLRKKRPRSSRCIDQYDNDHRAENAMNRRCKITIRTTLFAESGMNNKALPESSWQLRWMLARRLGAAAHRDRYRRRAAYPISLKHAEWNRRHCNVPRRACTISNPRPCAWLRMPRPHRSTLPLTACWIARDLSESVSLGQTSR